MPDHEGATLVPPGPAVRPPPPYLDREILSFIPSRFQISGQAARLLLRLKCGGPVTYIMWIPMALFEVAVAFWLILKGVATPAAR